MTEETYEAKRIELDNTFFVQFRPNMFVGVRYRFENLFALKPIPGGLLDEGAITGAEGGISYGIGLSLRLDNRDNILNPQSGEYLATSPLYFSNLTGSNFSFTLLEVDLRKYCKAPLKSIVALQTFTQLAFGSPPFRMMALLGGEM